MSFIETSPPTRTCPFCGAAASVKVCEACGRDPTAVRRVCRACQKQTPAKEATCCHCGAPQRSELPWKLVLIVLMFVAAFGLAVLVHSLD